MRTRSGAALLVMALLFLLLGLATLRWELVSMALPLAIMLYLAFLLHRPPLMEVQVSRTLDAEKVLEGEEVEVSLRLENRGEELDYVEVLDGAPAGAAVVMGRERFPLALGKGSSVEVRYRLRFDHRGSFPFEETLVRWSDPTMMFHREQRSKAPGRVLVLPRIHDLRRCDLRPSSLRMQAGNVPSASLGPGSEFFCVREYVPGDEMRRINWKVSARRDRLVVNEHRTERSGDVVILLDARTGVPEPGARQGLVDLQVEAAASLASYFLKRRDRVGLLVLGDTMDVVPLGFGKRHFAKMMERLIVVGPSGLRSTGFVRMAMGRYFPTSSLLVAITPLEDSRIMASLQEMGGRGHDVFVLSPDPFPLEAQGTADGPAKDLAERMHRMRRADSLAELGRHCRAVDWDPRVPLSKYLTEDRASAVRR